MKLFFLLIFCAICFQVNAQHRLIGKGTGSNKYVAFLTEGSETIEQISAAYGIGAKKMGEYNKIKLGMKIPNNKEIRIPLSKANFLKNPSNNAAPIFHNVKKGENLYRISTHYFNVPEKDIMEWNRLSTNIIRVGQSLIVGYFVNAKIKLGGETAQISKQPVVEQTKPIPDPPKPMEPPKLDTIKKTIYIDPVIKQVVPGRPAGVPVKVVAIPNQDQLDYQPKEGDEGFYAKDYSITQPGQTQQFKSGDAAIFKTITGWNDRKFYVLLNDVAPNTIVRITSTENKSVCAMVLGPLQETKAGNGLLVRISNAAAAALGAKDAKFLVTITYFE